MWVEWVNGMLDPLIIYGKKVKCDPYNSTDWNDKMWLLFWDE